MSKIFINLGSPLNNSIQLPEIISGCSQYLITDLSTDKFNLLIHMCMVVISQTGKLTDGQLFRTQTGVYPQ